MRGAAVSGDPWAFQRWAFETTTGNSGRKAVLVSLAVMADKSSGRCEAKQETIARQVEAEVRTVRRHLADLEKAGLIARRSQFRIDGRRRGDEFLLLAPWVTEWPDGQAAKLAGGEGETTGHIDRAPPDKNDPTARTETAPLERPLGNDHLENNRTASSAPRASELDVDAAELLKGKQKVGSKIVTEQEMAVAVAALRAFNLAAGSNFGIGTQLTKIVGRIRERPSWTAAVHERLVASAFRLKWWERSGRSPRRPTPSVIYGNADVFEQVIQDAKDEHEGKPVDGPQAQRPKMERTKTTHPWDEEM